MKIQGKILKSAGMILLSGAIASAQATPGGSGHPLGSLANDIRPSPAPTIGGQGSRYAGPILDGGSTFVDLGSDERLVLTVGSGSVRLSGGTPGNAGAILVDLKKPSKKTQRLPADSAAIQGSFGMDGSFTVDLPPVRDEVFVQGVEFTPIGGSYSGIARIAPPGQELSDVEVSWDANAISDAVRRATSNMGDELVRMRFFGAARRAGVNGSADITIELGKELQDGKASYALHVGAALAQRTMLVDAGGDAPVLHFRRASEVADAIESLFQLDAFAGIENDLAAARIQLDALREQAGHGRAFIPRCPPTITLPHLGKGPAVEFGDASSISEPRRAGDKQVIPEQKAGGAGRFAGQIKDGGTITVDLGDDMPVVAGVDGLGQIAEPQRAGDKQALPAEKTGGSGRYTGPIGDAGTRTVDLSRQLAQAIGNARKTVESLGSVARSVELMRHELQHSGGHVGAR